MEVAEKQQKTEFPPGPGDGVKFTINLDWLEMLLSGNLVEYDCPLDKYEYDQGNITLVKKEMGTKQFKHGYELYVRGKIFGLIFCSPRNTAILDKDTIQFKAENNVLYELGFIQECEFAFSKLRWKVKNVSRTDIALDGAGFMKVMLEMDRGDIEKLGKATYNIYKTGKRQITGFDVGKKSSAKWITGYYKGKELEKSNKYYIGDMWKRAKLSVPVMEVERLEVKLRNEELKKIKDFDWRRLGDFEYLASVYRTAIKNYFDFVKITTDSNIARAERVSFIDWSSLGGTELERLSTEQTNEVYAYKLTAKRMYGIYIQTGINHYADVAQEIAININCLQWYIDRMDHWKKFFEAKLGHNQDGEITYPYLSRYKTYGANEQLRLYAKEEAETGAFYRNKNF